MDKSGSGLCDAVEFMREHGGEAHFSVSEGNTQFVGQLLQARQVTPGALEPAIALHPYGTYITNHLRFVVMPQAVMVWDGRSGPQRSEPATDLFSEDSGNDTIVARQRDRSLAFTSPTSALKLPYGSLLDIEFFRSSRGGHGSLSHLLRIHFVRYLSRFESDGLFVDFRGDRAYFVKRGEETTRIRYDTARRQGIEREVIKRREYRNEAFHENEGFGFAVVRFDDVWAIEVKPFYMFTGPDGVSPLPPHRRTKLSTSRMRFDRNVAVKSDLGFWARYLSQGSSIIKLNNSSDYDLVLSGSFHEIEVLEPVEGEPQ